MSARQPTTCSRLGLALAVGGPAVAADVAAADVAAVGPPEADGEPCGVTDEPQPQATTRTSPAQILPSRSIFGPWLGIVVPFGIQAQAVTSKESAASRSRATDAARPIARTMARASSSSTARARMKR
jgi:hypothetical protein